MRAAGRRSDGLRVIVEGVSATRCEACGEVYTDGPDLADLLDVAPETVSRWENGHRSADRSVWNTLADLLANAVEGKTTTLDLLRQKARLPKAPLHVVLRPAYGH